MTHYRHQRYNEVVTEGLLLPRANTGLGGNERRGGRALTRQTGGWWWSVDGCGVTRRPGGSRRRVGVFLDKLVVIRPVSGNEWVVITWAGGYKYLAIRQVGGSLIVE